eukprot:gene35471-9190_t
MADRRYVAEMRAQEEEKARRKGKEKPRRGCDASSLRGYPHCLHSNSVFVHGAGDELWNGEYVADSGQGPFGPRKGVPPAPMLSGVSEEEQRLLFASSVVYSPDPAADMSLDDLVLRPPPSPLTDAQAAFFAGWGVEHPVAHADSVPFDCALDRESGEAGNNIQAWGYGLEAGVRLLAHFRRRAETEWQYATWTPRDPSERLDVFTPEHAAAAIRKYCEREQIPFPMSSDLRMQLVLQRVEIEELRKEVSEIHATFAVAETVSAAKEVSEDRPFDPRDAAAE